MTYISFVAMIFGLIAFNTSFASKKKIKELEQRISQLEGKSSNFMLNKRGLEFINGGSCGTSFLLNKRGRLVQEGKILIPLNWRK